MAVRSGGVTAHVWVFIAVVVFPTIFFRFVTTLFLALLGYLTPCPSIVFITAFSWVYTFASVFTDFLVRWTTDVSVWNTVSIAILFTPCTAGSSFVQAHVSIFTAVLGQEVTTAVIRSTFSTLGVTIHFIWGTAWEAIIMADSVTFRIAIFTAKMIGSILTGRSLMIGAANIRIIFTAA